MEYGSDYWGREEVSSWMQQTQEAADGSVGHNVAAPEQTYSTIDMISGPSDNTNSPTACVVCQETIDSHTLGRQLPCGHHICAECLVRLILISLSDESAFPPRCCPTATAPPLSDDDVRWAASSALAPPRLWHQYRTRQLEWSVPPLDRVYCVEADCRGFVVPGQVGDGDDDGDGDVDGVGQCRRCKKETTCLMCRGVVHPGQLCNSIDKEPSEPDEAELRALMDPNSLKRCPRCHRLVSLEEGCYAVKCRCGHKFCFACGTEGHHNCECVPEIFLREMGGIPAIPPVMPPFPMGRGHFPQPTEVAQHRHILELLDHDPDRFAWTFPRHAPRPPARLPSPRSLALPPAPPPSPETQPPGPRSRRPGPNRRSAPDQPWLEQMNLHRELHGEASWLLGRIPGLPRFGSMDAVWMPPRRIPAPDRLSLASAARASSASAAETRGRDARPSRRRLARSEIPLSEEMEWLMDSLSGEWGVGGG